MNAPAFQYAAFLRIESKCVEIYRLLTGFCTSANNPFLRTDSYPIPTSVDEVATEIKNISTITNTPDSSDVLSLVERVVVAAQSLLVDRSRLIRRIGELETNAVRFERRIEILEQTEKEHRALSARYSAIQRELAVALNESSKVARPTPISGATSQRFEIIALQQDVHATADVILDSSFTALRAKVEGMIKNGPELPFVPRKSGSAIEFLRANYGVYIDGKALYSDDLRKIDKKLVIAVDAECYRSMGRLDATKVLPRGTARTSLLAAGVIGSEKDRMRSLAALYKREFGKKRGTSSADSENRRIEIAMQRRDLPAFQDD